MSSPKNYCFELPSSFSTLIQLEVVLHFNFNWLHKMNHITLHNNYKNCMFWMNCILQIRYTGIIINLLNQSQVLQSEYLFEIRCLTSLVIWIDTQTLLEHLCFDLLIFYSYIMFIFITLWVLSGQSMFNFKSSFNIYRYISLVVY